LSEVSPDLIALHGQNKVHGAISVHTVGLDEFGHAHLLVPALYPDHAGSMEPASCFAAVEQFDADPAQACGPWTDVYALCAVMCSLVSGSPPPHALARRAQDSYVPLAMRKPRGYEEAFLAAIDQGLSLAPAQRPQSVAALCEMLGVSCVPDADEAPVESRQAAAAPMGSPQTAQAGGAGGRRRRAGSLLAVAAGVLVVAGIGAWLSQDDVPDEGSSGPVVVASRSATGRVAPPPYVPGKQDRAPDSTDVSASPYAREPYGGQPASPGGVTGGRTPSAPSTLAAEPAWTEPSGGTPAARPGPQAYPRSDSELGSQPGSQPGSRSGSQPGSQSGLQPNSQSALQASSRPDASSGPESAATEAGGAAPAPRPARVTVKVDIRPWGEIFVDGVSRGVSPPLKTLHLPAGRHTVEVRNANLPPYKLSMELKAGRPVTLEHVFR
jgi:hypothetical protein